MYPNFCTIDLTVAIVSIATESLHWSKRKLVVSIQVVSVRTQAVKLH